MIAGSAGGYFFGKRKGNLFFLSPFLSFSRHGVLMVIQSMRFIDNGRTVPQVLKASPPLSTLSSSPRSRGMHPIIGTLSVSLRGDNDALPPIQPPPSLPFSPLFCIPTIAFLFLLSDLNRLQKISFIHCVPRYPVKGEPGEKERERGRRKRERERKRSVEQSEETDQTERKAEERERAYLFLLSVFGSCRLCTPAFL